MSGINLRLLKYAQTNFESCTQINLIKSSQVGKLTQVFLKKIIERFKCRILKDVAVTGNDQQ